DAAAVAVADLHADADQPAGPGPSPTAATTAAATAEPDQLLQRAEQRGAGPRCHSAGLARPARSVAAAAPEGCGPDRRIGLRLMAGAHAVVESCTGDTSLWGVSPVCFPGT